MPRNSNLFLPAAWILFVVSLFLPAADSMLGWHCAAECAAMITKLPDLGAVYYFAFTIPNLLMLLSPLLVFWMKRETIKSAAPIAASFVCSLYVFAFGLINVISKEHFNLSVGYYLWLASFCFLSFGLVVEARRTTPTNPSPLRSAESAA